MKEIPCWHSYMFSFLNTFKGNPVTHLPNSSRGGGGAISMCVDPRRAFTLAALQAHTPADLTYSHFNCKRSHEQQSQLHIHIHIMALDTMWPKMHLQTLHCAWCTTFERADYVNNNIINNPKNVLNASGLYIWGRTKTLRAFHKWLLNYLEFADFLSPHSTLDTTSTRDICRYRMLIHPQRKVSYLTYFCSSFYT